MTDEVEAVYRRSPGGATIRTAISEIRARLRDRTTSTATCTCTPTISPDCATPAELLLETAKEQGLGAIAITDHNEISGALEAREIAERIAIR